MSEDVFDELLKEVVEALRRMRRMQEELEYYFTSSGFYANLYEDRMKSITGEAEEPLVEIRDLGDEVVILVDISGVKQETLDVRVGDDRVEVYGLIDERKYEEAFTGWHLHVRKREFHGAYQLPFSIDPESVRVEKKGSLLVIRARKKATPS